MNRRFPFFINHSLNQLEKTTRAIRHIHDRTLDDPFHRKTPTE